MNYPARADSRRNQVEHQSHRQRLGRQHRCRRCRQRRFRRPQPRGGGGDIAEAHGIRSLIGYNIPNGTPVRITGNVFTNLTIQDDNNGCTVTFPAGSIPIPERATTVTIPNGTQLRLAEPRCFTSNNSVTISGGTQSFIKSSVTANLSHASARIHEVPHSHSATYATGTGFFCGRLYRWSDFQPGESRPLFLTAARRSLMGWVWVDSVGQQVVQCSGGPPIPRLTGQ